MKCYICASPRLVCRVEIDASVCQDSRYELTKQFLYITSHKDKENLF